MNRREKLLKKIFRKNQIIITTLAVMIAVAGYLNYSGTMLGTNETSTQSENKNDKNKEVVNTDDVDQVSDNQMSDISEEDIFTDTEDPNVKVQANATEKKEDKKITESIDKKKDNEKKEDSNIKKKDAKDNEKEKKKNNENSVPGEAVLTSSPFSDVNFIAEAKLTREQVRSKNKEVLLEVINNKNVTDDQKQSAIDGMLKMTENSEREMAAEVLLEAKGIKDAVVTITDNTADVVVNMSEVTDAKRAQIEDVMKRKTGVSAENIVITPIQAEEK